VSHETPSTTADTGVRPQGRVTGGDSFFGIGANVHPPFAGISNERRDEWTAALQCTTMLGHECRPSAWDNDFRIRVLAVNPVITMAVAQSSKGAERA
jgi:hypothetical protein